MGMCLLHVPNLCSYMSDVDSWMELADLYVQVNE